MGASRKLQGEIDRVLKKVQEGVDIFDSIWNKVYDTDNVNQKEKYEADLKKEIKKLQRYRDQIKSWIQSSDIKDKKVSASYEQALVDSRKQIEREMERFKICEKETKTKAFSKEGLGQQPKTDPKEKAKSKTRDWLNNVVGELESQIDSFEAEMEGLSVKKGKTRPPRLKHLETSIFRHKSHVMKLELILRLLDNDELSPEHVNDVKDFLEDYLERNQEDFEDFTDVDEFYSTLPLEVEALEDLVTMGQPGLAKGGGAASSTISLKTSSNALASVSTSSQLSVPLQEPDETNSQDSNSDAVPKTPPSKISILSSSNPASQSASQTSLLKSSTHASAASSASASVPGTASTRGILESVIPTSPLNLPNVAKEEDAVNLPGRRSSPALTETTSLTQGIGRGSMSSQPVVNVPLSSVSTVASSGMTLGAVPLASDVAKRNVLGSDEMLASSVTAGRAFSSSMVPGTQWRPGSSLQSQNDVGQLRGRTEFAPDQKEKFLQRFQQVQQGHANLLGVTSLGGENSKPFSGGQQNSLLQQFSSQSSFNSSQANPAVGLQSPGLSTASSAPAQQEPVSINQQAIQQGSLLLVAKNSVNEDQQQQNSSKDLAVEVASGSSLSINLMNDDDLKVPYVKDVLTGGVSGPLEDSTHQTRDSDLSPGQRLQSSQAGGSLGVIGRRSVSDLGAIGDSIGGTSYSGGLNDRLHTIQMLEAAYYKLPQPKDSERAKSYTPRHPATTPSYYPQVQAPIVNNPAFWDRLGLDPMGTDTLFFAFYYQPNTYQQYLAAKDLKKQSWRFHRKFHTWFQRHEEPKVATDECEKGTYVYFDFHVANDDPNQGWCQRIKADFTFEYSYLEDELIV